MESGSASANVCGSAGEHPAPLSESVGAPSSLQLPEVAASNDEGETRNQPEENEPSSKKAKTSEVWKYYDDIWVTKIGPDGVEVREQWAKCKKCSYKGNKNTMRGTTVFWNHMKNKHNLVKGQQRLASNDGTTQTYRYDAESSLRKWQLAMVMHEYPFNMVEHEYFIDFIKSLRPGFSLMSRISTRSSIMEMFVEERKKLYNMFKSISCRFSCTMDMWTSNQNKGYMCITVHWIDDNWHIQKRIVKFMHVKGNHTGQNLANEFVKGVMAMNLEKKLFALTLDNASANDKCVKEIIPILMKHEPLICDGVFFHVRCLCHILNLVAQDGLKAIASSVKNIRETIAIVKNSPLQWEEFQKCALECGLDVNKGLSLDVSTRWNSTFAMLSNAVYFKRAFERLLFLNETKYRRCAPTDEDWDKAQSLSTCLQKFSDATDLFSGHSYPTANLFWWKFCDIKLAIEEWSHDCDETICCMSNAMQAKYEKYWDKSNIALAVACFLDPKYKKRLVEYFMKKIYREIYDSELTAFMDVVKQLFQAYNVITPAAQSSQTSEVSKSVSITQEIEDFLYDQTMTSHDDNTELEIYMKEPCIRYIETNDDKFDVLAWWRDRQGTFPVLSQLARDVLAIQVSTVASESAFSAGGRVLDPYRSRLDPEMVEALICIKDWTLASKQGINISKEKVATFIDEVDMEVNEKTIDQEDDILVDT